MNTDAHLKTWDATCAQERVVPRIRAVSHTRAQATVSMSVDCTFSPQLSNLCAVHGTHSVFVLSTTISVPCPAPVLGAPLKWRSLGEAL